MHNHTEDEVTNIVIESVKKQQAKGLSKYDTTLYDNNTDNFFEHAIQESIDLLQYLTKLKINFKQLCDQYPNDNQLGAKIREIYGK